MYNSVFIACVGYKCSIKRWNLKAAALVCAFFVFLVKIAMYETSF